MNRITASLFVILTLMLTTLTVSPVLADDDDDDDDREIDGCVLFGTAARAEDPTDPDNEVISIDDSPPANFGGLSCPLRGKIGTLTGLLSLNYYLQNNDCGGGSPRIQLRIDTDGDGNPNGNAFGYIGPSPNFMGCTQNSWQFEDLTDGVELEWDLTQFGGPFYNSWDTVVTFFNTLYPNHRLMRGVLVEDSSWLPTAAGVGFYDNIRIGSNFVAGDDDGDDDDDDDD